MEESLVARTALEVYCVAETKALPRLKHLHSPGEIVTAPRGFCEADPHPQGVCFAAQPYPATPPP